MKSYLRTLFSRLASAAFFTLAVVLSGCAGLDNNVGTPPRPGDTVSKRVRDSSSRNLNKLLTRDVPGTNQGRLACAWAVNRVVKEGVGKPVGGGLSTAAMYDALRSGRGKKIEIDGAPAGAVIISPTQGANTGHVGILANGSGSGRKIHSNSSAHGRYEDGFTVGRWSDYYSGKGLQVLVYQLNP
jgi:hypothetical protein